MHVNDSIQSDVTALLYIVISCRYAVLECYQFCDFSPSYESFPMTKKLLSPDN